MKAIWNGVVIAESDQPIEIEGNMYFPPESVNLDHFVDSEQTSTCPWKGNAKYKTIVVNGEENSDAAWYYPTPSDPAKEIKGYFAFWKGVEII